MTLVGKELNFIAYSVKTGLQAPVVQYNNKTVLAIYLKQ